MHQCSSSIRGGLKHLILIILKIHIIVSYDQNISLIIFVKMDSMSNCDIRLMFTFPPKDSTLQYKKCVHLWNNFPCISTLLKCINNYYLRSILYLINWNIDNSDSLAIKFLDSLHFKVSQRLGLKFFLTN